MIGMPWGPDTNWARNVMAASGASLRWKGRELSLTRPRIVDATEAAGLARAPFDRVLRRFPAAIVLERQP